MTYRYRFTGEAEEVFPLLPVTDGPVTRVMNRGDVVECSEPVEHARLALDDAGDVAPLASDVPAAFDHEEPAAPEEVPAA